MFKPLTKEDVIERITKSIEEAVSFADLLIIDTCSLVEEFGPCQNPVWDILNDSLRRQKKYVTIPRKVYEELRKLEESTSKKVTDTTRRIAHNARKQIKAKDGALGDARTFRIEGDGEATHADPKILNLFEANYVSKKIVIVTQDRNLACDLIARAQTRSVRHQPARILYVDNWGAWLFASNTRPESVTKSRQAPFRIATRLASVTSTPCVTLSPARPPKTLRTKDGSIIEIHEKLGQGGEGIIYATDTPSVAKLFFEMSPIREAKLKLLEEHPIKVDPHLAYPSTRLFDEKGATVGILMPYAKGRSLHEVLQLDPQTAKPAILKECPWFAKHHLVQIAKAVVRHINVLHSLGIVLGDINQDNFLVELPIAPDATADVWVVDIDSAQIEGYPCLVQKEEFVAPWRLDDLTSGKPFLRTLHDDGFALSVLIFHILLAELFPYQQKELRYDLAARNCRFPFATAESRRAMLTDMLQGYALLYGLLPVELRGRFTAVFDASGYWVKRKEMPQDKQWMPLLSAYEQYLRKHPEEDAFEFPGEVAFCKTCGFPFLRMPGDIIQVCPQCRQKMRVCENCGREEQTNREDERFYCLSCRKEHRKNKIGTQQNVNGFNSLADALDNAFMQR
mgnify:CR=1 FL=1